MKIEITVMSSTREIDGWTVYVSENDAERIELKLKSRLHEVELTYLTKSGKLVATRTTTFPAGLFKECPLKSGDHESALKSIEKKLSEYSEIPSSIDVIWNGQ